LDIVCQVLAYIEKEPHNKTEIVYQNNLNFRTAGILLNDLVRAGLVERLGRAYSITPDGRKALVSITEISELIRRPPQ
jgi:predicted transcriptional regulator